VHLVEGVLDRIEADAFGTNFSKGRRRPAGRG